jgi:UDP-glucuronate 4-epimerase
LEAAVKTGVAKFVFASSSSVYGNTARVPFHEDDPATEPISPYAATKRAGELLCHTYWHLYRMPVTCLRFFTVYGPRQRPDLAIHKFARLITDNKPVPLFGDGSTSRDYTYIDDIVAGVVAGLARCDHFDIYNLGSSNPVPLSSLVEHLACALGKPARIEIKLGQPGDVERTFAETAKARAHLNFSASTPLDVGITRFVEWFNASKHENSTA